jgi:hypothetical protein
VLDCVRLSLLRTHSGQTALDEQPGSLQNGQPAGCRPQLLLAALGAEGAHTSTETGRGGSIGSSDSLAFNHCLVLLQQAAKQHSHLRQLQAMQHQQQLGSSAQVPQTQHLEKQQNAQSQGQALKQQQQQYRDKQVQEQLEQQQQQQQDQQPLQQQPLQVTTRQRSCSKDPDVPGMMGSMPGAVQLQQDQKQPPTAAGAAFQRPRGRLPATGRSGKKPWQPRMTPNEPNWNQVSSQPLHISSGMICTWGLHRSGPLLLTELVFQHQA